MNKKTMSVLVLILLISLFTACKDKAAKPETVEILTNNSTTKQAVSTMESPTNIGTTQQAVSISKNEFDINYNGITINADIPFETIAKELGINIVTYGGISDSCTENYAANTPYSWNIAHYPNKENEEISIEYVYNEETRESYIVYVDLFGDTETYRGIKVGDSLDKFSKAYSGRIYKSIDGNSTWCHYIGDESNKIDYSGMCVLIGKDSYKIEEISIDYNITKARDEMQLYGD